jgi:hypothetical protein
MFRVTHRTAPRHRPGRRGPARLLAAVTGLSAALLIALPGSAGATTARDASAGNGPSGDHAVSWQQPGHGHRWHQPDNACPPAARALGYSDALDKLQVGDNEVGGLSGMVYDVRRHAYAAIEDHSGDQVSRMWFFTDPADPRITGTLTLSAADGTPYSAANFDAEGLTILPNGDYVVSSEVEPSIHVFGRDGVELYQLPVPARFDVAPAGEATDNATLEGLSLSPDGRYLYAAMEGTLSGDISTAGTDTYRRILVYQHGRHGYHLIKQVGYQVDPGMRISEAQAYGHRGLLVMEAAWDEVNGNTIRLYAVPDVTRARDVSDVSDLGDSPDRVVRKVLVADVTNCPTLGATAKEAQTNPLMDNFEAMTVVTGHRGVRPHGAHGPGHGRWNPPGHVSEVLLLSDDNFGATQTTRLLRLAVPLPQR